MSQPSLALCIPAYNAANFLARLLEGARAQSVPFDEILVYDDASTDATGEIAARYGATVIRGDENVGCSRGKNALAARATSEWLHFHDADDGLYPEFVESATQWLGRGEIDVVLFGFDEIEAATGRRLGTWDYDGVAVQLDPIQYAIRTQIQSIIGIYRRERFLGAGGYDTDPLVLYNEDVAMHCQLARAGLRFAADPAVTVINYRSAGSMSSNGKACARAQFHVMRKSAEAVPRKYAADIRLRLWRIAAVSGGYLDWTNVDACVSLAERLGGRSPDEGGLLFRMLCTLNPRYAHRVREYGIRWLQPHLRAA
jgi:glycosyltransferase involved in cell wall biosynthesis